MKIAATILVFLLVAPPARPQRAQPAALQPGSRWLRLILPPAASPMAEQCVIADAELYAHAAPGLRDVRLMQDGQELPYAMDVSFDTRAGEAAPPPADDRAEYEPVLTIPLLAQPGAPGEWTNEALLSAHVPIERVRVEPAPATRIALDLRAAARMELEQAEELHATLTPPAATAPFTIGANLQEEADILVRVRAHGSVPKAVVLEMRRRELCYRPRSTSPVLLFLGDPGATAVHYEYALHFQPSVTPLLSAMGPIAENPDYNAARVETGLHSSVRVRLAVSLVVLMGSLLVIAFAVYELRRGGTAPKRN